MGTWSDTQAAYFGEEVVKTENKRLIDSERSEKCNMPFSTCSCCPYSELKQIGYKLFKSYCTL